MADQPQPLQLLSRGLDQAQRLIAATTPEQAALPTPCRSWTVRHLVEHLINDPGNFAAAVRGEKPAWGGPTGNLGDDWAGSFASSRHQLDAAWESADLKSLVPSMGGEAPLLSRVDQQIAEFAVHAWDLARATGQSEDLDPEVAEHGLRWATQNLKAQFRGPEDEGKAFGAEVPVADTAPVYERLAGWFGRDPRWSAGAG
ncbi:MAG: TIGR03086 family protein [Candidatus Dormibacteraeota bacterium]|uniref:TIGR03086 family protein n=1 Tax=Candidatus Aeolococcus gillhamiae TaxID=3127015 RepID=A0A2W5Z8S6_9BACT|nr:TIGR03086 family protein [Candidatus Dormibacteraeota bacterium]PZR79305.1 MAG: TIGR03086 family protein [Candidatus Dormibacter sp. RRmetagenome_bin12]